MMCCRRWLTVTDVFIVLSLLVIVVVLHDVHVDGLHCETTPDQLCTIGHDHENLKLISYQPANAYGFYLNTQHKADCNGSVTTWEYCYYKPEIITAQEYRAAFGIYRISNKSNSIITVYHLVEGDFIISISRNEIMESSSSNFTCQFFATRTVTIQKGDVIGVSMFNGTNCYCSNSNTQPLNLVGNSSLKAEHYSETESDTANFSLRYYAPDSNMTVRNPCSLPENLTLSETNSSGSLVLHIYGNITDPEVKVLNAPGIISGAALAGGAMVLLVVIFVTACKIILCQPRKTKQHTAATTKQVNRRKLEDTSESMTVTNYSKQNDAGKNDNNIVYDHEETLRRPLITTPNEAYNRRTDGISPVQGLTQRNIHQKYDASVGAFPRNVLSQRTFSSCQYDYIDPEW